MQSISNKQRREGARPGDPVDAALASHRNALRESMTEMHNLHRSIKEDTPVDTGLEEVLRAQREMHRNFTLSHFASEEEKPTKKEKEKENDKERSKDKDSHEKRHHKEKDKDKKKEKDVNEEEKEKEKEKEDTSQVNKLEESTRHHRKHSKSHHRSKEESKPQSQSSDGVDAAFENAVKKHQELKRKSVVLLTDVDLGPTETKVETHVSLRPHSPEFEAALAAYKRSMEYINSDSPNKSLSRSFRSLSYSDKDEKTNHLPTLQSSQSFGRPYHLPPLEPDTTDGSQFTFGAPNLQENSPPSQNSGHNYQNIEGDNYEDEEDWLPGPNDDYDRPKSGNRRVSEPHPKSPIETSPPIRRSQSHSHSFPSRRLSSSQSSSSNTESKSNNSNNISNSESKPHPHPQPHPPVQKSATINNSRRDYQQTSPKFDSDGASPSAATMVGKRGLLDHHNHKDA